MLEHRKRLTIKFKCLPFQRTIYGYDPEPYRFKDVEKGTIMLGRPTSLRPPPNLYLSLIVSITYNLNRCYRVQLELADTRRV